jgi:hypothetical protein
LVPAQPLKLHDTLELMLNVFFVDTDWYGELPLQASYCGDGLLTDPPVHCAPTGWTETQTASVQNEINETIF